MAFFDFFDLSLYSPCNHTPSLYRLSFATDPVSTGNLTLDAACFSVFSFKFMSCSREQKLRQTNSTIYYYPTQFKGLKTG